MCNPQDGSRTSGVRDFDDFDLQLGRRLRRRRQLLGLTQQALGDLCGLRFQQIQKYETAANRMSAAMVGRLAQALGVPAGYFYDGLEPLLSRPLRTFDREADRQPDGERSERPDRGHQA